MPQPITRGSFGLTLQEKRCPANFGELFIEYQYNQSPQKVMDNHCSLRLRPFGEDATFKSTLNPKTNLSLTIFKLIFSIWK